MTNENAQPGRGAHSDGAESPPETVSTATATPALSEGHRRMIFEESAVYPDVAAERGYRTVTTKAELRRAGFSDYQARNLNVPGLLIPVHTVVGGVGLCIYRPDVPSLNSKGKLAKYVMPSGCSMALDVHPRTLAYLADPRVPLAFTEGIRKVDAAVSQDIPIVGVLGVWNWRGKNGLGGKTALPDFDSIALEGRKVYLVFDSDVMEKLSVYRALVRLRDFLRSRGAMVRIVYLPSGEGGQKVGLDDWFAAAPGRTFDDLAALSVAEIKPPPGTQLEAARVVDVLQDAPVSDELVVPYGYEVGPGGIVQTSLDPYDEKGEEKRVQVTRAPVLIGGGLEDVQDGSEYLVLQYLRHQTWRKVTVGRATAMNARELVHLASRGLPVTSGRAGGLVEYLDAFEASNRSLIPRSMVSSHLGWQGRDCEHGYLCGPSLIRAGDGETPPGESVEELDPVEWREDWISFRGADEGDEQIAAAFRQGGSYAGWRATISPVAAYPRVMLAFYASLAPPLLQVLGAANFIVDLAYPTSRGKTTSLRVAGSCWGVVEERAPATVIHTWRATRAWIDRASSVLSGLPLILDETNRATDPRAIPETLYDVANGRGKGRGSVTGTRRTGSWSTVLLSSGEYPAVNRSGDGGTHARTLTVHGPPFGGEGADTARVVALINQGLSEHHGHAGPRFVRHLVEHRDRWEAWREEYREVRRNYVERANGDPVVARMADYFAVLDMAARLADEALDLPWEGRSPVEPLYDDLVAQASGADKARDAMTTLAGWASANEHKFRGRERLDGQGEPIPPNDGWAGKWSSGKEWDSIAFYTERLRELLRRWEHDPDSVLASWRVRGWLDTGNERRRTTKKVSVEGAKVWMAVIRREAVEPEGDTDEA